VTALPRLNDEPPLIAALDAYLARSLAMERSLVAYVQELAVSTAGTRPDLGRAQLGCRWAYLCVNGLLRGVPPGSRRSLSGAVAPSLAVPHLNTAPRARTRVRALGVSGTRRDLYDSPDADAHNQARLARPSATCAREHRFVIL
jgi:hypothetical protein